MRSSDSAAKQQTFLLLQALLPAGRRHGLACQARHCSAKTSLSESRTCRHPQSALSELRMRLRGRPPLTQLYVGKRQISEGIVGLYGGLWGDRIASPVWPGRIADLSPKCSNRASQRPKRAEN